MLTEDETTSTLETESFVDIMDVEQTELMALSVTPRNKVIGVDANVSTTQVCASMKARELPADAVRAPVDILVALDVSGSMYSGKLDLCKSTLELLLRNLLPQDRFGLVAYSDDATTEVPLQCMDAENKQEALKKIKALRTLGWTNISAAISLAFQELRAVKQPNKVQSVFLLTDGHANQGITDHDGLVKLTKNCANGAAKPDPPETHRFFGSFLGKDKEQKQQAASSEMPVSMFCFGYGNDHNAALLRGISDATESGSYYHVKDDSDVGSAFGDAMGGLLSVLAQSAVLTIRAENGTTIKKIHHDRVVSRDQGMYTVNIGDFYAEEQRDVLIQITLAPNKSGNVDPIPHLSVSLAYTDVIVKKPVQSRTLVCSIARPQGAEISMDDTHVAAQWLRILAADEMEAASKYADRNDLVRARERLDFAWSQINSASDEVRGLEMVRQLQADLETAIAGLTSQRNYQETGSKYLQFKSQTHRCQRSAEAPGSAPAYEYQCYMTASKKAMTLKLKTPKK